MAAKYSRSDETFVNPYHFVPLGKSCARSSDRGTLHVEKGSLTGWLECSLETVSPVFIPDASKDDVFRKRVNGKQIKSFDFYSRDSRDGESKKNGPCEPVITGSELRGVFRSAFEAVTNSCMSTVDGSQKFFKRTTIPGKPGRIVRESGKWYLQPCQERMGIAAWKKYGKRSNQQDRNDFTDLLNTMEEGQEIRFTRSPGKYHSQRGFPVFYYVESLDGNEKGYIHKGENFTRKHHETVFVTDPRKPRLALTRKELENLLHNFELYRDEKVNQACGSGHGKYSHVKADTIEDLHNALVYYRMVGDRKYLSPAAIGREVFHTSLADLIGDFAPCSQTSDLCPACALFGFVSGDDSLSGRVRFGDAFYQGRDGSTPSYLKPMVIPELSSPKPSATEFYLERPRGADLWNYDYSGTWQNQDFVYQKGYRPRIRGRKFYWHGGKVRDLERQPLHQDETVSDRNVMIRPLDKGERFLFRVYFNEVSEIELQKLLWVISIGSSHEHGHKIGMGKPVGLGSIEVNVDDVRVRRTSITSAGKVAYRVDSHREILEPVKQAGADAGAASALLGGDEGPISAFLAITRLDNGFGSSIDYPRLENPTRGKNAHAVFHWFVANKQVTGKPSKPRIDQELPPVGNPAMKKIKDEPGAGRGSGPRGGRDRHKGKA